MSKLSVIIITKNEEKNIAKCLRSIISIANEIIVVDSGSTDKTLDICRQFNATIVSTDWPGYGQQKNRALKLTHYEWILSLDADEWVRTDLRNEIRQTLAQPKFAGYLIPRVNMFCGRFQRYGDSAKDEVLRLFRKQTAKFTDDFVHEKVICTGEIGRLQNRLLHNSSRTLAEWTQQMNRYTELTAQLRYQKGKRSNPAKACLNSGWIFFRSYLLRQGFRDGYIGFQYAKLNAISSFRKNILLWNLRRTGDRI